MTGVSGSGKSSLINGTLARALQRHLTGGGPAPGPYKKLTGIEHIQRLLRIEQSSIGRTARSTPRLMQEFGIKFATCCATRESKQRGYKANRFSYKRRWWSLRRLHRTRHSPDRDELLARHRGALRNL